MVTHRDPVNPDQRTTYRRCEGSGDKTRQRTLVSDECRKQRYPGGAVRRRTRNRRQGHRPMDQLHTRCPVGRIFGVIYGHEAAWRRIRSWVPRRCRSFRFTSGQILRDERNYIDISVRCPGRTGQMEYRQASGITKKVAHPSMKPIFRIATPFCLPCCQR